MHIRHMLDIGIIMPFRPFATKAVAGCLMSVMPTGYGRYELYVKPRRDSVGECVRNVFERAHVAELLQIPGAVVQHLLATVG